MPEVDQEKARELMRKATENWRAHGFDLDFEELGYQGDRNDVAAYMDTLGWASVGTPMSELLADYGLPPVPQSNDSGLDGRHDLLHLGQVTQTPQRRGFNDVVTRFWGVAAPAYKPAVPAAVGLPPGARRGGPRSCVTNQSARIVDVACGTGILADRIERDLHPAASTAVDMSEGMLNQARSRSNVVAVAAQPGRAVAHRRRGIGRCRDDLGIPLLRPSRPALREFHRVLAQGGLVAVSTMSARQSLLPAASRLTPAHNPTSAEMRRLFEGAGFTIVEQHRVRRPLWTRALSDLFTVGVTS